MNFLMQNVEMPLIPVVAELEANIAAFDFELPSNLWSKLESAGLIAPVNI